MKILGRLIEERVDEKGMSKAEFARRINRSPQNVNDLFKRKSIDVEFLVEIGQVLEYDFFKHFVKEYPLSEKQEENIITDPIAKRENYLSLTVDLDGTEEGLKRWVKILQDVNQIINSNSF